MSIEPWYPVESSSFITTVAPELVFSAERIMQAKLTALEESLQPDNNARSQAAYVIVKALMEEPRDPMKVPDDPNDYIEDEVIVAIDLDEHLPVEESDPRKTFLVTRFLEPLVEWEVTNEAGERVAATLPAEWSDIEAAYKSVSYAENQTQIGLQQDRVEASSAAGLHINHFATTLRTIPAFNRAVVDYMAPGPHLLTGVEPDVEEQYIDQFWLLRRRLATRILALRSRGAERGLRLAGGSFPVQATPQVTVPVGRRLLRRLDARGVRAVLRRDCGGGNGIALVLTATNRLSDVTTAADELAAAWFAERCGVLS